MGAPNASLPHSTSHSTRGDHLASSQLTRFYNGFFIRGEELTTADLWINNTTGRIVDAQEIFFHDQLVPATAVDLEGRIVAPGFIDVQLNGATGFDISELPHDGDMKGYREGLESMNRRLACTGVTSYLATMTSQPSEVYHKILPHLKPTGDQRNAQQGAEILGAHCEGPFMAEDRRGCHPPSVISNASSDCSPDRVRSYYGPENLQPDGAVKMITLAPELPGGMESVETLSRSGTMISIGHSDVDYEGAATAIKKGAKMITHLFNAMAPLHHRDPGPFGTITKTRASASFQHLSPQERPYFGIIADGIHLHPASVSLAFAAHPDGLVLVTDAVRYQGCADGTYDWTNGQKVQKKGAVIMLEEQQTIAGSAATLIDCINNFMNWTGSSIPEAIGAATRVPAALLGVSESKGSLEPGSDADLVILKESPVQEGPSVLSVDEVWKFGQQVHSTSGKASIRQGVALAAAME